MAPRNRLADRRRQLRFELAGQLSASLDVSGPFVIRNLAVGGALIETRLRGALKTIRLAQLSVRSDGPAFTAVVRHVTPLTDQPGEDRHLVGLEFVHVSTSDQADLEHVIRTAQDARR